MFKPLLWICMATALTAGVVYVLTRSPGLALAAASADLLGKVGLYYFYGSRQDKKRMQGNAPRPFVMWFTGLPCSGKSTLADRMYDAARGMGIRVERLDGDTVRSVFPQTGFTKEARDEHIRRVGFLASVLERNGISVVASFVSPYVGSRDFVRALCGNFIEVYVDTPLEECKRRDVKGMYKKAAENKIANFTGLSDPYEAPLSPEIVIDTTKMTVEASVELLKGYISLRRTPKR